MRMIPLALLALLAPTAALAHPGHVAEAAGHDHWVAGAAIGIALGIGILKAVKGRRKTKKAAKA